MQRPLGVTPSSNRASEFPRRFESLRKIEVPGEASYLVGAMFTAAYAKKAERLAASCRRFGLPFVLHEVPTVHCSISGSGTDDLSFTKANFIHHLLATHRRPVLYLDVDCEFASRPSVIDKLAGSRCDFAIYNQCADEAYTPYFNAVALAPSEGAPPVENRFYRYVKAPHWYTTSQLWCLGCVQFYANTMAARGLLAKWHQTITAFRGSPDDLCMNFTFNNLSRRSWLPWVLNVHWLPSAYARLSHWICTEPVINHPDETGTNPNAVPIADPTGRKIFYRSRATPRSYPEDRFLPGAIVDIESNMLCELVDGRLVQVKPANRTFWT
jgi:hypothetical protein